MNPLYHRYAQTLEQKKSQDSHRFFKSTRQYGQQISYQGNTMLNLSSNDYLGLAQQADLVAAFWQSLSAEDKRFSSTSSRLLTGHCPAHERLETVLDNAFGRSSLTFNSGYHMNVGILPALSDDATLIISDELIHASIIDGIRLSKAQRQRYRHQDLDELAQLLSHAQDRDDLDKIIIVTESIFSMDGDVTDLTALVRLKQQHPKVMLYVDEAHAIGVYGDTGLGVAEAQGCVDDIDLLLGTFGKALASVGGYLICDEIIRDYLINTMRPLIFSTALPPINLAWTAFVFEHMQQQPTLRDNLHQLSEQLRHAVMNKGYACPSHSHIVPVIYGDNQTTVAKTHALQQAGFYILPIRVPTVPAGTARIRIGLHAGLQWQQIAPIVEII